MSNKYPSLTNHSKSIYPNNQSVINKDFLLSAENV